MKQKQLVIGYEEYDNSAELVERDRILLDRAKEASARSYSPYSKFSVGAAVLLANGDIVDGSNQENAAYPSGLCAERVALFYAASKYPGQDIEAIAITAVPENFTLKEPVTPCGSCRQVIAESESQQSNPIRIIMSDGNDKVIVINGIRNLLPLLFHLDELKR